MTISKFILIFHYFAAMIIGIVGLIFYKSVKAWITNLLFNRLNPYDLPQQSNSQTNIVLIATMVFLIIYGLLGFVGNIVQTMNIFS